MNSIFSILKAVLVGLGLLMIGISLLSLMQNNNFWLYKSLDFPRLQYLIIIFFCLICYIAINRSWRIRDLFFVFGLVVSFGINGTKIAPYYFGSKVVPEADVTSGENNFSVIISNVLMNNKNSEKFIKIIKQNKPDIILAMEVDNWWIRKLQILNEKYPFSLEYPLDNAYGMALYSKFPLNNMEVKFLKHSDVPSFHGILELPSGKKFNFHGMHPVPPYPSTKYPNNIGEEEVELVKVGKMVAESEKASMVAGDFNDVSWSHTTHFFEDQGNLKNVRIGRGLYNTYSSQSWFMRWPLDHFFVTKEFSIVKLERLGSFGSDHFPLLAEFYLKD